jgi:1-acyl-sn-glycerol-3-phosphate acyltransferase
MPPLPTDRSSTHPGHFDREVLDGLERALGCVTRRFWPGRLDGLEHLPSHDRFLLVANHSAMGSAELWSLVLAWHDRFGGERPVAGMAHPGAFRVPILRSILRGLGAVEATRAGAAHARAHGAPLLLFPGGDHEATRPFWQADRVDFGGRMGWIRLAREHGLDIVPMCISNSHRTLPIIARGKAISWLIGTRALGVHRAALPLGSVGAAAAAVFVARALRWPPWAAASLAWASIWGTMMVPFIPSPIGFHLLPPLRADDLGAGNDSARDRAIHDGVVNALERRLVTENARARAARSKPSHAAAGGFGSGGAETANPRAGSAVDGGRP